MAGFVNGFALIIGVSNYLLVPKLPKVVSKDAKDIYSILSSPSQCGYQDVNIRLLLDEQATAQNIRDGLLWLSQAAHSEDTCFIYFSGHGGRMNVNDNIVRNYLIPFDCEPSRLDTTAIADNELTDLLNKIAVKKIIVIFDSCYSGGTGNIKSTQSIIGLKSGFSDSYYEKLASGRGRIIMASSRSDEVSLVLPGMENSLFTAFFLEALQGKARTRGDGLIRVFDIFDYVSEEVPAHGSQHPIFKANNLEDNFVISLYLGGLKQISGASTNQRLSTLVDKRLLREELVRAFSTEELEMLCADIQQDLISDGINVDVGLDISGGEGKAAKVLNLIQYLDRRKYLAYLVAAFRRERPGII